MNGTARPPFSGRDQNETRTLMTANRRATTRLRTMLGAGALALGLTLAVGSLLGASVA